MKLIHSGLPQALLAAGCAVAAMAAVLTMLRPASAQDVTVLPAGETMTGEVTDRFGDEWVFTACAGDLISITMRSDEYDAYLELYPPTGRKSLAEAEVGRGQDAAILEGVELDESGEYVVIAAGEGRNDQGAYTLTLAYGDSAEADSEADSEAVDGWLLPADPVSGTIGSRFGQEWAFRGCAGDVVDVDMESDEFDTYLELYPPTGRRALAEDDNGGRRTDALIEGVELEESGIYIVVAGGAERTDTGDYALLLSVEHAEIVETPTTTKRPTRIPTRAPTRRPTRRPTATRTRTPTPEPEICTVQVSSLNLRSGPGVAYSPPIGAIPRNAALIPLARNADATWIEIEVAATGRTGWVSSAAEYVDCAVDAASLPLGLIPPTPRPTATLPPTATPTSEPVAAEPTPTPPAFVILPGGGDAGPFEGDVVSEAGLFSSSSGLPTFRDRIFFRLLVREQGESRDGAGVDRVEISVQFQEDSGGQREVYSRTERTAGFCAFGGGEPNCDVVRIGRDARWPDTDTRIENGDYEVNFRVVRDGDSSPSANWRVPFTIDNSDLGSSGDKPDLVARVAQTGPGTTSTSISGRAVFKVEAYDPSRGSSDGDGIENVDIRILGPDGREVYQRTENNVAYCAFSGGEPDCEIWDFNAQGGTWPSGESFQPGPHRVQATVNADDGRRKSIELIVKIE